MNSVCQRHFQSRWAGDSDFSAVAFLNSCYVNWLQWYSHTGLHRGLRSPVEAASLFYLSRSPSGRSSVQPGLGRHSQGLGGWKSGISVLELHLEDTLCKGGNSAEVLSTNCWRQRRGSSTLSPGGVETPSGAQHFRGITEGSSRESRPLINDSRLIIS